MLFVKELVMCCVYVHITPNNKLYIGMTTSIRPSYRWGKDGSGYVTQRLFWRAIQKYGWNNIQHLVLIEGLSKEVACECEKYLIAKYQSNNPKFGYNLAIGGEVNSGYHHSEEQKQRQSKTVQKQFREGRKAHNYGKPMSEEQKKAISNTLKGRKQTPEQIEKRRIALKGHKVSEETRQKLHDANVGKIVSAETRAKLSAVKTGVPTGRSYWKGKHFSDEHKEKIRQGNLGIKRTDEFKKRVSEGCKGKKKGPMSEEQKQKISEALIGKPKPRKLKRSAV